VDDGNVGDGDALWHGYEDVAPSLRANGGAVCRCASAGREAVESVEGWLKGGVDAHPVHSTVQNPFRDVMLQLKLCGGGRSIACRGRCPYGGGWLCSCTARWGFEGRDCEAEAVS
jgi:hypothetical protein